MTRRPHPAYLAEAESRRWTLGPLTQLLATLMFEAAAKPGEQCWRVLPGGAYIMVRRREDDRHELRIARREKPADPAAFDRECETFLRHVRADAWERQDDPASSGICHAWLEPDHARAAAASKSGPCPDCGGAVELQARIAGGDRCIDCETMRATGHVRCERCAEGWVKPDDMWTRQLCGRCAGELGREYTAEVRARLARD